MKRILLSGAVLLAACATAPNPYQLAYKGVARCQDAPGCIAPNGPVEFRTAENPLSPVKGLAAEGYRKLGEATVPAAQGTDHEQLLAQAQAIGAQLVVASDTGTDNPGRTVTFWSKHKTRLGIFGYMLDDNTRALMKTPGGLVVETVVKGSGAASAGILPGDLIVHWNDEPIRSNEQYQSLVRDCKDTTATLSIWRDGRPLTVKVPIANF